MTKIYLSDILAYVHKLISFKNYNMKIKKIFILLGIATLFASSFGTAAFAVKKGDFNDIDWSHDNYRAVDYLHEKGVLEGYRDGSVKPDLEINRAEFLKIVMMAAGSKFHDYEEREKNFFPDVSYDDWYYPFVDRATELGYVKGYDDGYFRPEKKINFIEASKIIANVLDLDVDGDIKGEWYEKYVKSLEEEKAIPRTVNSFTKDITRGEMSEIVWRVSEKPSGRKYLTYSLIEKSEEAAKNDNQLVAFDTCTEIKDYVSTNTTYNDYIVNSLEMVDSIPSTAPMAKTTVSEPSIVEASGPAADFSQTNVQVFGVDEADIIKNDGEYIYLVKGDSVRIVRAYPPENMTELDAVDFGDEWFSPSELYVDGDKMVVIGSGYKNIYYEEPGVSVDKSLAIDNYYYNYSSLTKAYILDISDRSNIEVDRWLSFEGRYDNSRKVDDMLYMVMNKTDYAPRYENDDWYDNDVIVPLYVDSRKGEVEKVAGCGEILHYPPGESTSYLTVVGIDISDSDSKISKKVILGSAGEVYASRENFYVTESSYNWWWRGNSDEETVVHKFGLGDTVDYLGKGSVPGTILNQFSMDEYKGNFRIATTLGSLWDEENPSTNNLYILDEDLKRVGDIEGIAPGEKIYSVRFMGKRAYMVTFKKVDPFFVIDVADAENPKILGKLKIPGYSDYLHPYDEDHIIGFGKEAVAADEDDVSSRNLDFAWYQGMKIAMFDVTDVSDPIELHKVEIGDRGTSSPLLYDHKALLFDKSKGLMSFPVTVYELSEDEKNDPKTPSNTSGDPVFQGAYVYDVSVKDGFELKGKVTHYSEDEIAQKAGSYWWGDRDISRVLYIGDYLYTISQSVVQANALDGLEEVAEVELAGGEDDYDYEVY